MNFIALAVLLNVNNEEKAFWVFVCIIEDVMAGLHGNVSQILVLQALSINLSFLILP